MSYDCYNGPYSDGAITAEEFVAGCGREECGGEESTALVCCCRSVRQPERSVPRVEEGCCCKQSFRAALQLLCDEELAGLLDFESTAFLTDHYSAGVALTETVADTGPADNLDGDPEGSFRRFSPGNCDLLDISAPLYAVPATAVGVSATQAILCELLAVVIQLAETEGEGELSAEEVAARNFRRVRRILSRSISPCSSCSDRCSCADCEDCCCAAGLLGTLAESNLSRRVSLAAGPLLLQGVTLLGTVGGVLVLANDEDQRIYFVCVNSVELLF